MSKYPTVLMHSNMPPPIFKKSQRKPILHHGKSSPFKTKKNMLKFQIVA